MTDIHLHYTLTSVPTSEQSPVPLQGQLVHEIIAVSCENETKYKHTMRAECSLLMLQETVD
jgi:hypothetical protein